MAPARTLNPQALTRPPTLNAMHPLKSPFPTPHDSSNRHRPQPNLGKQLSRVLGLHCGALVVAAAEQTQDAYLCCEGRALKAFQPSFCSLVADVPFFISMPRMAIVRPQLVRIRRRINSSGKVRSSGFQGD